MGWMILRGISYSLWIHFSVVLIQKAGALINQYVSASRKLFSVILSFIMFGRPFYFMHGIGFIFFVFACFLKIYGLQKKQNKSTMNDKQISNDTNIIKTDINELKTSDTDCDVEEFGAFPIPTNNVQILENKHVKNRKYITKKIEIPPSFQQPPSISNTSSSTGEDKENDSVNDSDLSSFEEVKNNGYIIKQNPNTNRLNMIYLQ